MIRNKYRITLYDSRFFSELFTYDFPVLPGIGDLIEVETERTMFVVQARAFPPQFKRGLVPVTLHGVIEGSEHMGQHTWEQLRDRILNQRQGEITLDENYKFPETLD